jgi:cell wall-associated NlpC family hydrolase
LTERAPARHRADSRPSTPLTGFTSTFTAVVGDRAATLSRGGVVVAVSSGLMTGMGLPAQAAERSAGDTAQTAAVPLLPAATAAPADALTSTPVTGSTKARVSFERSAFSPAPATAKAASRTTAATATREIATISRSLARAAYLAARPAPAPVARPAARLAPPAQPAPPARHVASDAGNGSGSNTAIVLADDTEQKKDGDAGGNVTPPTARDTAAVVAIAMRYVGIPYRYGGTTPRGFDCSGFTQYVYRQIGISLPRTAAQQMHATTRISRSQARVGDLVFYLSGGVGHVGIYLGNGKMIDSPRTGRSVSVRAVYSSNVAFGRV